MPLQRQQINLIYYVIGKDPVCHIYIAILYHSYDRSVYITEMERYLYAANKKTIFVSFSALTRSQSL